jgi:hypothetical protein
MMKTNEEIKVYIAMFFFMFIKFAFIVINLDFY